VIALSGAQWYTGAAFPEWRGGLFIGALYLITDEQNGELWRVAPRR
jgi:glucose/arabinose dehydrogenase